MVSRGEMALIIAQVGYSAKLLTSEYYSGVIKPRLAAHRAKIDYRVLGLAVAQQGGDNVLYGVQRDWTVEKLAY